MCDQPGCEKVYSGRKALRKHLLSQHNITMSPGRSGRPAHHSADKQDFSSARDHSAIMTEKAIIIEHIPGTRRVTGSIRKEFIVIHTSDKVREDHQKNSKS